MTQKGESQSLYSREYIMPGSMMKGQRTSLRSEYAASAKSRDIYSREYLMAGAAVSRSAGKKTATVPAMKERDAYSREYLVAGKGGTGVSLVTAGTKERDLYSREYLIPGAVSPEPPGKKDAVNKPPVMAARERVPDAYNRTYLVPGEGTGTALSTSNVGEQDVYSRKYLVPQSGVKSAGSAHVSMYKPGVFKIEGSPAKAAVERKETPPAPPQEIAPAEKAPEKASEESLVEKISKFVHGIFGSK
ncbi:hypothetical protein RJ53_10765 [Methanocalculus chunghsingensis]|uniref:Uncharacterized protein n=1 Tax=Methanocalculus chunghsingensis TaxID=156457 RepID=A0A8J7WBK9_9EURY|nr:hypothetical protein [Methanocalculus chunghsingensis]MBR1369932.1 hypothetical protein [Methanocalculus chunghsingensis]